jgi:hypothetical protein
MNKLIVVLILCAGGVAFAQPGHPGAPTVSPEVAALRKTCVDAMNADPDFAKSIVATADKQIDQRTLEAHQKAAEQIAENELHVILAYAVMWVLAALFVVFLWRRQQVLKAELVQLRRDLDAAAKETK